MTLRNTIIVNFCVLRHFDIKSLSFVTDALLSLYSHTIQQVQWRILSKPNVHLHRANRDAIQNRTFMHPKTVSSASCGMTFTQNMALVFKEYRGASSVQPYKSTQISMVQPVHAHRQQYLLSLAHSSRP